MADPLYEEICRVYEQFRIANLKVRYHGSRAQNRKKLSNCFQLAVAVLSLCSLVVLAAPELRGISGFAYSAVGSSALAAILAGAIPFLGFEKDAKTYSFLNRSYQVIEFKSEILLF